ncbi:MAG: esterase/lipase family protein [Gemmatimonadales bacterium]
MARLELAHDASDSSKPLHVIFVHGLGGHVRHTWMYDPKDASTLWPRWVGEDLQYPVWLLEYDAALSGWSASAMPLSRQGATVLDLLAAEPRLRSGRLVLVGHSLGGLVIKTALLDAITLGVKRYSFFPRQLRGVVFIATPHFGSHLANLAAGLRCALRTNEQVGDMKIHDPHLTSLNTQFRAQHKSLGFAVRTYCEAHPVTFPSRLFGLRPGPSIRVVDGADPHVDGDSGIYLPEDHFGICKPRNREAQIHKSLVDFLQHVRKRELNPFNSDFDGAQDLAGVVESDDALTARVSNCQVRIVAGRLESQAVGPSTVVVLPCNEYFDDKCANDSRSALGAYVGSKLGGRTDEFMALVREQCRLRFGAGQLQKKTDSELGESFGIGRCLILENPLGTSTAVALLSTSSQRAGEGLASRVSDLFLAIEALASRMADARLSEAVMPVLGAGHGGLTPAVALSGLLLAIAQVARERTVRLRRTSVVVFRKDEQSPMEISAHHIRQAMALIADVNEP